MKPIVGLICFVTTLFSISQAQMCPGGGTAFASAVTFDPAWIYGCNTGTSCNGGVNFDNRTVCEPTTAPDACAPIPTCTGAAPNGSDIWFRFYASASTVTLNTFQNTSFVIGIQAFSGGPTCGSLTQIGCAVAAGPSSGVIVTLTGLVVGQLYYYRVFGNANNVSQRTGLYCFCGTTGLQNYVLPAGQLSFTARNNGGVYDLLWTVAAANTYSSFEVQESEDGRNFHTISTLQATSDINQYNYGGLTRPAEATSYYRLKVFSSDGKTNYSSTLVVKATAEQAATVISVSGKTILVQISSAGHFVLFNASGIALSKYVLAAGKHEISVDHLMSGIYYLHHAEGNVNTKVVVL